MNSLSDNVDFQNLCCDFERAECARCRFMFIRGAASNVIGISKVEAVRGSNRAISMSYGQCTLCGTPTAMDLAASTKRWWTKSGRSRQRTSCLIYGILKSLAPKHRNECKCSIQSCCVQVKMFNNLLGVQVQVKKSKRKSWNMALS